MMNVGVLRARKGVKGVGRKIAQLFLGEDSEVTCGFKPKQRLVNGATIINYGRSEWPIWWRDDMTIINSPDAIKISSNKIRCLEELMDAGVPCLDYTTEKAHVLSWFRDHGIERVFVRHSVHGKRGQGIEVLKVGNPIPKAPLYTVAYEKKHEFRVFVAGGKVVDIVQKKKMSPEKMRDYGIKEVDMDSRNYKKGWVFAHKEMNLGKKGRAYATKVCLDGMKAVGLDYGAVDLLYKSHDDMVICEINSAPEMRRSNITWSAMRKYFLWVTNNEEG